MLLEVEFPTVAARPCTDRVLSRVATRGPYTAAMAWFVYLLECRDGSIYTGIATDVARRYAEHAAGKGARYTRARPPVRLLASFEHTDRSSASRAEYAIKRLTPARKRALCGDVAADPIDPPVADTRTAPL